ncbi:PleD family two-component system response regulator [Roseomonas sp. CECT 9278]|uniref:PleD family two-component system response regulator n=1 Tax=Roseomonas sp. CECT 9278 TaxID=2845823 RepID=UPI001E4E4137|nr:PleD family two-component system response regulator [Roseomonas sp. CECT 9278]CAH0267875.1 Response regulator PleD [Roseomonas sp. CECT 9278]
MTARVLVVDDVPANLRLLEAKLRAEYFEVALAASGPEALALATAWAPDVILLDIMMPGMDGYEVCRRLKAQPATAHIPVVMVTALTEQPERVRGLQAGADDFISKPVDTALLFARLRALLRVKQVLDAWRIRGETARDMGFDATEIPEEGFVGARLLLAGGQAAEAEAVGAALAADGILLDHAPDEAAAWERLQDEMHDLALLSLPLAGGDALRLASRMRARSESRDMPLVLLAAEDQRQAVLRAFDLGASDHVMRPVDAPELRARVRNQLRRRRYQELLRESLDRSLELAVTDALTGLRNRRYVRRHLDGLLRSGSSVAVLLLDVDRFKPLNDRHGHAAGDVALKVVADTLREHLRAVDVVARYGGEEFMVVMASAGEEEAGAVAERLRAAIADRPIVLPGLVLALTVSIGTAITRGATSADRLVAAADAALYRAKEGGRNRVEPASAADWSTLPE